MFALYPNRRLPDDLEHLRFGGLIYLGVGVGQWGEEMIITPADLVTAVQAQVVELVEMLLA